MDDYTHKPACYKPGRCVSSFYGTFHLIYKLAQFDLVVNKVGKIDHKPGYHNDLTEAVCGATVHCVRSATGMAEVEILTMADLNDKMEQSKHYQDALAQEKRNMPQEMRSFIEQLYALNGGT